MILSLYLFTLLVVFWFLDYVTTPLLSQNNNRGDAARGTIPSPIRNFQSQMVSFVASEVTTYLASILELVIHDCFTLLQLTTPPPKVNTNPEVDLWEFLSS